MTSVRRIRAKLKAERLAATGVKNIDRITGTTRVDVLIGPGRTSEDLASLLQVLGSAELRVREVGLRRGVGENVGGARTAPRPAKLRSPVQLGLAWLHRHRDPDGHWSSEGFSGHCDRDLCSGEGNSVNDVGVTALALLAFLEAGGAHPGSTDRVLVADGLRYLRRVQGADHGCFGPKDSNHFMYSHALATRVMVEGFRRLRDQSLQRSAQRGVDFLLKARNSYKAWRYDFPASGDNDISVTGYALSALYAARREGLRVDPDALSDGMAYVADMTSPTTWRTGYQDRGSPSTRTPEDLDLWPPERSESMTARAVTLRILAGQRRDSAPISGGVEILMRRLPVWDEDDGSIDFLYWYSGAEALRRIGNRSWVQWKQKLRRCLIDHQIRAGHERGSWNPEVDPWGDDGGRVYATAINTLSLLACEH